MCLRAEVQHFVFHLGLFIFFQENIFSEYTLLLQGWEMKLVLIQPRSSKKIPGKNDSGCLNNAIDLKITKLTVVS